MTAHTPSTASLVATIPAARAIPEADSAARVAWMILAEPGDAVAGLLIAEHGAGPALDLILAADTDNIITEKGAFDIARYRARRQALGEQLLAVLAAAQKQGAELLTPADPDWPTGLADLGHHAPFALWLLGDRTALTGSLVAVTGARAATGYGEHNAAELAAGLSATRTFVAGGAYGIEGCAHRAALASNGRTVAFLAGGLDRLYPTGHASLLERIAATDGCAIVSELPFGATPSRWRFLQRNRLIAAVTAATIVVEAGARSGSLNTAAHAERLGRPVGAVPGPITSASSAGCHRLIREFGATLITSRADIDQMLSAE